MEKTSKEKTGKEKMNKEKISKETKAKFKGKETWVTVYEGHEIKLVNQLKVTLYIDGVAAAKQKGLISTNLTLAAEIPGTDKMVVATLYSSGKSENLILECRMVIGNKAETTHGFQQKDGTFAALTPAEEKQYLKMKKELNDAATVATISSII